LGNLKNKILSCVKAIVAEMIGELLAVIILLFSNSLVILVHHFKEKMGINWQIIISFVFHFNGWF